MIICLGILNIEWFFFSILVGCNWRRCCLRGNITLLKIFLFCIFLDPKSLFKLWTDYMIRNFNYILNFSAVKTSCHSYINQRSCHFPPRLCKQPFLLFYPNIKLELVQNSAARIVCMMKNAHVTPLFKSLH